jgi:hypothetical protein
VTSGPADGGHASAGALSFVIRKHWASRLHYDFRLELDDTMRSRAVPKGPYAFPGLAGMSLGSFPREANAPLRCIPAHTEAGGAERPIRISWHATCVPALNRW